MANKDPNTEAMKALAELSRLVKAQLGAQRAKRIKLGEGLFRAFYANEQLAAGMAAAVSDGYKTFTAALDAGDATNAAMRGWLAAIDRAALSYEEAGRTLFEKSKKGSQNNE